MDWANEGNSVGVVGGEDEVEVCRAGAVGSSEMEGMLGTSFLKSTIMAGGRFPDLEG